METIILLYAVVTEGRLASVRWAGLALLQKTQLRRRRNLSGDRRVIFLLRGGQEQTTEIHSQTVVFIWQLSRISIRSANFQGIDFLVAVLALGLVQWRRTIETEVLALVCPQPV
jgi:hypothetical protein